MSAHPKVSLIDYIPIATMETTSQTSSHTPKPVKPEQTLNFLLIAPSYACKPITGAGQRTGLIFKTLKMLGSVEVLLVGNVKYEKFKQFFPGAKALHIVKPGERSELGFWRLLRPFNPSMVDAMAIRLGAKKFMYQPDENVSRFFQKLQTDNDYNFVIGRYLRPTVRAGALHYNKAPIILDIDDRDDVVYRSRLNLPGLNSVQRIFFKWYLKQTEIITDKLLPRCDHLWLTSEADAQEISHPSKSVLPNIPYSLNASRQNNEKTAFEENHNANTVLFVGSFAHRVNQEGVERFILNCWPKIQAAVEGATLRVVGSGNWAQVKDRFNHIPNVNIIGFADDLEQEYRQAAFTIAPLFEGGGTKIKVLETLFYQRTAVITRHAQYGYETLRHKESLWVADTEDELIQGCISLLCEPKTRAQMAATGREKIIKDYSFERFSRLIHETTEQLMRV